MATEAPDPQQKSVFREYAEAIIIALILALFIRTFVVQAFKIPSGSMIPTLLVGDHILVNKFVYGIKNPFTGNTWLSVSDIERKDVIVFKYPVNPDKDFIKRVIGIPGDRIRIVDKKVYVNDKLFEVPNAVHLDPDILKGHVRDTMETVVIPENSLFVMGDNRDNSHDSRFWRFVDMKAVKGKAFMLYWSWDRENFSVRWNRLGDLIH
ncbi:MAG: signal peptidase I [Desulfobulbaceae bacterium]|nr:signal peptidase I [Desulfobulbaceae bacterium]MCK5340349.1 signal peptidase I [Desulfobulbaceae bacterium]